MPDTPPRRSLPLPTVRGWWLVAAGIAAGLLAFLVLWLGQRGDRGLYRPDEQPPAAAAPVFQPLPAPPASGGTASTDLEAVPESGARIEEPAPPPPPPLATAGDGSPAATPDAGTATGLSTSAPVPIEAPSPSYPRRALRRGDSGEVVLRVQVDARGVPGQVEVASSSGSRDLDRAAQSAVQRWRFRPAMRDGVPVPGAVNVPVTFKSPR